MTPRLSVLLPTFNRIHWLDGALDSVLEPGLDCELVVLDNGSSDGTWARLGERARLDPRIRPVRWEVNGAGAAYPALLAMARGEYVNFFADDDEMLPGGLARKMAVLDTHPGLGLVFSAVRCFDAEGKDLGEAPWTRIAEGDLLDGTDFFPSLILSNFVPMPSGMFRRAAAPAGAILGEPRFSPSGDWQFWLKMVRRTAFGYLREPTVRLRLHGGQVTAIHGVQEGGFIQVNLRIWRHWMLEAEPVFIPSAQGWGVMMRNLAGALQATHGHDLGKLQAGLRDLQALRDEQDVLLARTKDEEEAQYPEAFLLEPAWTREDWRAGLHAYLRAFSQADPVVLALLVDPARPKAPSPAQAQGAVDEALAGAGQAPPPVRVLEPAHLLGFLRAFPHVQWLPNPGAPLHLEGAKGRRLAAALASATGEVRP